MKKVMTAVIYDKWLSQLGGGERVACISAKILKNLGFQVTFISGRDLTADDIRRKLNIDLSGIHFKTVWNDEFQIKKISEGKDLFINFTFMDFSRGYAKKNLYYTHFPTRAHNSLKGRILNNILLPALVQGFIPQEPIKGNVQFSYHHVVYSLNETIRFSYYYLTIGRIYTLEFKIYLPYFSKSLIARLKWKIEGGEVKKSSIIIDHRNNIIKYTISLLPSSLTIYLEVNKKAANDINEEAFLIYKPQLYYFFNLVGYLNWLQQRLNRRFRAGLFRNVIRRIRSYDLLIANSNFTRNWIGNYWKCDSKVIYPPVDFILNSKKISHPVKKKWICSIGRFFTTGHGKKQEILIQAFKKFSDRGYGNWELHLIGGVDQDKKSQEFIEKLKREAKGYPIFIHNNIPYKKMAEILRSSRFYWHATGYGENERSHPIRFEHFGISAVEATSAMCIPILFRGGGLKEIISLSGLDFNKNMFSKIDELVDNTIYFIEERKEKLHWKKILDNLNSNFSFIAFEKKFNQLLE